MTILTNYMTIPTTLDSRRKNTRKIIIYAGQSSTMCDEIIIVVS